METACPPIQANVADATIRRKRGTPGHRRPHEREAHREQISRLFLIGLTQTAIAKTTGIAQVTVSKDLAWLRDRWREVYQERLPELRADNAVHRDSVQDFRANQTWRSEHESAVCTPVCTGDTKKANDGTLDALAAALLGLSPEDRAKLAALLFGFGKNKGE
jgi:hypothetical protein